MIQADIILLAFRINTDLNHTTNLHGAQPKLKSDKSFPSNHTRLSRRKRRREVDILYPFNVRETRGVQ